MGEALECHHLAEVHLRQPRPDEAQYFEVGRLSSKVVQSHRNLRQILLVKLVSVLLFFLFLLLDVLFKSTFHSIQGSGCGLVGRAVGSDVRDTTVSKLTS